MGSYYTAHAQELIDLYRTLAYKSNMKTLEEIKKEYPALTANGWTYYSRGGGEKIGSGDILDYPKEFKAICDFLDKNIKPTQTINTDGSSYHYKHVVESNIDHYISNGMFIAAALACGFKMKHWDGPNCCFATSKKSWKPFEERYSKGGGSGPDLD